ncbi:MAG: toll/interleukin-1 receptor domain-containing protein [Dehalococcoidales bacterium]|nr:toll/interleukin-1 receptor domain-containing protein [Dehalococcoidales bacterium]
MGSVYQPPIAVHIIWHPSDSDTADPIIKAVSKHLSRDISQPFSRNLNIPIFLYSSNSPAIVPDKFPKELAERNIVFVFTSVNTRGHDLWNDYIRSLPSNNSLRIVPLALSREGLDHGEEGSLKNLDFIRAYEWPKASISQYAILFMAHEVCRHGFREIKEDDKGKSSSITIFLSHTKSKDTGRLHAESIKQFIDNTNMSHFFDATEISPGFRFDDEIINYIKKSTMVLIVSDIYSSRYWCQREILCAKENDRPMIEVDCLEDYEDRTFPAAANIPCVHVSPEVPLKESDILRVLTAAMLETIRHQHALKSLQYYRSINWIDKECELYSRPPELRQILSLKEAGKTKRICYPEPPIYSEESDCFQQLDIDIFTPLWSKSENLSLKNCRIGISISDVTNDGSSKNHVPASQLKRLAQDLARHILARSGTLIYGGDLRKDGFTEFILDEAIALKNRLNTDAIHVENYLAWPIYIVDPDIIAWRSKYKAVMKTVESTIPDDIASDVDKDKYLPPSTPQNKYYWSRCLTVMRMNSIDSSNARICAGGKLYGYNGKMPGVLEEILIAIEKKKPIYFLGAFGGVVAEVCKVLRGEPYPAPLTEAWQITRNAGYLELQAIARAQGLHADYERVKTILSGVDISSLSKNAGLSEETYLRLMGSPFVDECIHLITYGLKNLTS